MVERDLADLINQMRLRLHGDRSLGLPTNYLVTPSEHSLRIENTPFPLVHQSYVIGSSGLWLPESAARPPAPIDQIQVYLTCEEVFGATPDFSEVLSELMALKVEDVLLFVADCLNSIERLGISSDELVGRYLNDWFTERGRSRVRNALRDKDKVLLSPQVLLALAKFALVLSGDSMIPERRRGSIVFAMFGLASHLGADGIEDSDVTIVDTLGPLGREVVANQHFYSQQYEPHVVARFARRWIEHFDYYPGSDGDHPGQVFRSVTGVSVEDFAAIGMGFWAATRLGKFLIDRDYFARVDPTGEGLSRTLSMVSMDVMHLRARIVEDIGRLGVNWGFDAFERYPVIRLWSGKLLVLHLPLLVSRFFGWLPLYDVTSTLSQPGMDDLHKQLASRLKVDVENREELYFLEVLENLIEVSPGSRRVYDDAALKDAYARPGIKIADAAVDYGDAWLVFELTTSRLRRGSSAGVSEQDISSDLEKLIDEVAQIDQTISSIMNDEFALTGFVSISKQKEFYPVLVVSEDFPVNPLTVDQLRRRVAQRDLLHQRGVKELEVVNMTELEMIEGLQGSEALSLKDVFDRKAHAGLWRDSLRNFLLVELRRKPKCERVMLAWQAVVQHIASRMEGDGRA